MHINEWTQLLKSYQMRIEEKINASMDRFKGCGQLLEPCKYALLNGGKRFRPALVFMISEALNSKEDVSSAALAIEFFHTASLVADDLPCMDDDDERRGKPSVHKIFGEAAALLTSYALIAAGYEEIVHCTKKIESDSAMRGILALENASYNTGLQGATGGQFLDIFPPDLSLETLCEVIQKKTVSLFEISFVFGWLFGGGDLQNLPQIKTLASHFGMAFQIADDFEDRERDRLNGRKINVANVLGLAAAKNKFEEEIQGYLRVLKILNLESSSLLTLANLLKNQSPRWQ